MQIVKVGSLWIAHLITPYGRMELLCGDGEKPDIRELKLVEGFLDGTPDHIAEVRRSALSMAFLWRPIRFAVNDEGRLGLQFKHRLTGKQVGMFFADEHSSFKTRLSDIVVTPDDARLLVAHN